MPPANHLQVGCIVLVSICCKAVRLDMVKTECGYDTVDAQAPAIQTRKPRFWQHGKQEVAA